MIKIISIDPGQKGAYIEATHCKDTGVTSIGRAGKLPFSKTKFDLHRLYNLMSQYRPDVVVVERQSLRPGFNLVAGGTQMFNYGQLIAAIGLCGVDLVEVFPIAWASKMIPGTAKGESKTASISYAQVHYPEVSLLLTPRAENPHDGVADAICLLDYYVKHLMDK
jgi:hypothetical protein